MIEIDELRETLTDWMAALTNKTRRDEASPGCLVGSD